ncbi:MAG: hypothetical protein ACK4P3_01870 [Fimbriimonadaceae bacterium]
MNKWIFLGVAAAAVIVIGCGGGSGSGTTTLTTTDSTTSTTTTGGTFSVNLPSGEAQIGVAYLTGPGRNIGPSTAVINRQVFEDGSGVVQVLLNPERQIRLSDFTTQTIFFSGTLAGLPVRKFPVFNLNIQAINTDFGSFAGLPLINQNFPLEMRIFQSRQTQVPIYISDVMFNQSGSTVVLDRPIFEAFNGITPGNPLKGYIADLVSFDVRSIPQRPVVPGAGPADFVHFSGDIAAISQGGFNVGDNNGVLSVVEDFARPLPGFQFVEGVIAGPSQLPGPTPGSISTTPFGTYFFREPNPGDPTGPTIPSLEGIWRPYTDVLRNIPSFGALSMPTSAGIVPSSSDSSIPGNEIQTFLVFARNGNQLSQLYFGEVRFSPDGMAENTFRVWPIDQMSTEFNARTGALNGTVSGLVRQGGLVRRGEFTFDNGQMLPSGFQQSASFILFIR